MKDLEELAKVKGISIGSIIEILQNNPTYKELIGLFKDNTGEWDFYYMYDAISFEDDNGIERLIVLRPYLDILTELNPERLR